MHLICTSGKNSRVPANLRNASEFRNENGELIRGSLWEELQKGGNFTRISQ
ncbi:hypothetical protein Spb1_31050 [Planctopirus ephydatiae]|uniref:Uncharacterized protein n=1 Tax=Planctopirus ephydatiae TaxID=2528019 RepID=A0A518GRF0_9PLAN|nr:hypothetical protein Spb1_31050 [Planctopirus ephydatiae]